MTTLSPEDTLRRRILHLIVSLADETGSDMVLPTVLLERVPADTEMTRKDLEHHIKVLEGRRLVKCAWSMAGLAGVYSTPTGRDAAVAVERDRQNPVQRVRQLQDDYLRWLYVEIEVEDRGPTPDHFLATSPEYLGTPFTTKELEKAGSRLRDAGFITGQGAWQYDAPLRPQLTAKGRYTVESSRSVHDLSPISGVQNIHTHVAGNANVSVSGSHVSQSMTVQTGWADEVSTLLDVITQAVAALPQPVQADIAPQIAQARLATESQEPSKVRQALTAIGGFLNSSGSGALGGYLAAQIPPVLSLIS